ncbi:MAG: helical backbone metal receptor [Candidatus Hydrothermales bacterium]
MEIFSEFFGRKIELPENPKRVVSLAPDLTETIFRLNAQDRLVGISFYCRRPFGRLENFVRVGSYLNVLWERLHELKPDLVLTTSGAQREISYKILEKGYKIFVFSCPQTIYGIFDNIKKLGIVLNKINESEILIENLEKIIRDLKKDKLNMRVYYEIYLGGKITIGASSYINDGLRILGLENVYSFRKDSYFVPDDNETRKLGFDILLYEPHNEKIDKEFLIKKLEDRFGKVRILILPYDFLSHYGPSFFDEILVKLRKFITKYIEYGKS